MKKLELFQMESTIAGTVSCIGRGIAAPFMVVFSGFISSSYLDSWWGDTVDGGCFD